MVEEQGAASSHPDGNGIDGPSPAAEQGRRRRRFLIGAGTVLGAGLVGRTWYESKERFQDADVFIGKAPSYDGDLAGVIRAGLAELGIGRYLVRNKTVLLKPNLVEPAREAPHINTHPKVIYAAAEVFRSLDAREVLIAEGQGHCRDSDLVLEQSGIGAILDEGKIPFIDLNHDDVFTAPNRLRMTRLKELHLPITLKRADFIVSMPKLKTHHWARVTLSMKNLFGVMPGVVYGWPKNVLHYHGIQRSILDIAATVRPHLAIVDGIVGMEGDGPVMGTPRPVGALVMGTSLPAVDATGARLMGLDPWAIEYLKAASGRGLGPIGAERIGQRGETIDSLAKTFEIFEHSSYDRIERS